MTSERAVPSCNHHVLVCPAIAWAADEIDRLHEAISEERPELLSFDTIMLLGRRILAIYYPESVFDGSSGDSGPEFVVALRTAIKRIDEQRAHA